MTLKGWLSIVKAIRCIELERDVIARQRRQEAKGKGVRVGG